jgi:hypothetical protein
MLEDLDDKGIGTMMEDRITPTEEEYDDISWVLSLLTHHQNLASHRELCAWREI